MSGIGVLHVDDDPTLGELVVEFLQRNDERLTVNTVSSAGAGLERLDRDPDPIDCIVSDYDMPGQNGIEFLEAVRETHPDLPFILFTGKGSEEVASDAIASDATDYLQKEMGSEQYELLANRIVNAVEQYRTEREHQRVYQALETATEGIGILDEDGEYVYVNEVYAGLYGREPDDLVGNHWEFLYPDDQVTRFTDEILPSLETQGSWTGRSVGLHADGSTFTERLSLTQLDTGGHVCVVQDVSEQIEREQELRRTERQYRAFFEDPNTLVGLLETDGTLRDVNRTAMGYVAADREAVLDQPFEETPWWNHSDALQADLRRWIDRAADGEYVTYEVDHETGDGGTIAVEGSIRPVTCEDGEVVSLVASARVVSERADHEQ